MDIYISRCNYHPKNTFLCFSGPELVMMGVGYHHAGVDLSDRKLIEKAFTQADLPVLCESLYTTVVNVIVTLLLRTECT